MISIIDTHFSLYITFPTSPKFKNMQSVLSNMTVMVIETLNRIMWHESKLNTVFYTLDRMLCNSTQISVLNWQNGIWIWNHLFIGLKITLSFTTHEDRKLSVWCRLHFGLISFICSFKISLKKREHLIGLFDKIYVDCSHIRLTLIN